MTIPIIACLGSFVFAEFYRKTRRPSPFSRMRSSVTGLRLSIPFCAVSTAGVLLLYGVSAGLPPYGVRRGKGRSNLTLHGCLHSKHRCAYGGLTQSIVPAGTPLREGWCLSCPKTLECFSFRVTTGCAKFLCPVERRFSVPA